MSSDDRERWNSIYRRIAQTSEEPAALLTAMDSVLPHAERGRGRALDVAGGAGRNALWLARRGLDVTIVDISDHGLELARERAKHSGLDISTIQLDLDRSPLPIGPWDLIVNCNFLDRSLFDAYASALAPQGMLLISHPTISNLERHTRPSQRYLLDDGELPELIERAGPPPLQIIHYHEGWSSDGRHLADLIARPAEDPR